MVVEVVEQTAGWGGRNPQGCLLWWQEREAPLGRSGGHTAEHSFFLLPGSGMRKGEYGAVKQAQWSSGGEQLPLDECARGSTEALLYCKFGIPVVL